MMNLFTRKKNRNNNIFNTCEYLLNISEIKFNQQILAEKLQDHLDSPSLLTIKDCLQEYGIDSAAIRKGDYSYTDFELPFLSSIQQEDWAYPNFTVITDVTNQQITFLNPITNRTETISIEHFELIDKGIVLLIDTSSKTDEPNYNLNKKNTQRKNIIKCTPLFAILLIVVTTGIYLLRGLTAYSWIGFGFLLTALLGVIITTLLLWHEVDDDNTFLREVCGGSGKKANCDAILSSKKSSFLNISWSKWGFAYMTTVLVAQIIYPGQFSQLLLFSCLSIACTPYIIFSIYYQAYIVKQWCPLCLAIQALLFANMILALFFINEIFIEKIVLDYFSMIIVSLLGILFLSSAILVVPLLKNARNSKNFEKKWKKLRYNPEIFEALLNKGDSVASSEDLGIIVGDPNAKNEIIKICSPYCEPCSKAHPELKEIIKTNPDVKIRIIFNASANEGDIINQPISHLLAIQEKLGSKIGHEALDEWYSSPEKDYGSFAKKYPLGNELKEQNNKVFAMHEWCNRMKIRVTPTIYINGKELPEGYLIEELKNFF
ncbi:vitamin K epoxide reductase family protein [Sphingobacterium faecium]